MTELATNIQASRGSPAVIGGPRYGDGVLIIIVWANANRASAMASAAIRPHLLRWLGRPSLRRGRATSQSGRSSPPRIWGLLATLRWCHRCGVAGSTFASEASLTGREFHPQGRFPLKLHAASFGNPELDGAVRRAVEDWNAVALEVLGVRVFARVERVEEAQVVVAVEAAVGRRG